MNFDPARPPPTLDRPVAPRRAPRTPCGEKFPVFLAIRRRTNVNGSQGTLGVGLPSGRARPRAELNQGASSTRCRLTRPMGQAGAERSTRDGSDRSPPHRQCTPSVPPAPPCAPAHHPRPQITRVRQHGRDTYPPSDGSPVRGLANTSIDVLDAAEMADHPARSNAPRACPTSGARRTAAHRTNPRPSQRACHLPSPACTRPGLHDLSRRRQPGHDRPRRQRGDWRSPGWADTSAAAARSAPDSGAVCRLPVPVLDAPVVRARPAGVGTVGVRVVLALRGCAARMRRVRLADARRVPRAGRGRRIGRHGYGHQKRPRHHCRRNCAPDFRKHDLPLLVVRRGEHASAGCGTRTGPADRHAAVTLVARPSHRVRSARTNRRARSLPTLLECAHPFPFTVHRHDAEHGLRRSSPVPARLRGMRGR